MTVLIEPSNTDVEALARLVYAEAGNIAADYKTYYISQGDDINVATQKGMQLAYGTIIDEILNRVAAQSTQYGTSIQDVIDKPGQYDALPAHSTNTWSGLPSVPTDVEDFVDWHLAQRAMGAESSVGGATHYYNPSISSPDWGGNLEHQIKVGVDGDSDQHVFGDLQHFDNLPSSDPVARGYEISYDGVSSIVLFPIPPIPVRSPFGNPFIEDFYDRAQTVKIDPLVIDLNHDGQIGLNAEKTVYFDMDHDGFAEAVNWVSADDGLLVRDVNANENIDNITELFGDATQSGFAALSALDINADDVINSLDDVWADLKVWQDVNQDGSVEDGELLTLSSLGITAINLDNIVNIDNAEITQDSTVTTASGDVRISNVVFEADIVNTRYNEDYTLDIDTLFLPTLRGHGKLPDLHIAASINTTEDANGSTLKDKLVALRSLSLLDIIDDVDGVKNTIQSLMFQWAGHPDISNERGQYIDSRVLYFMESYLNDPFTDVMGNSTPGWTQAGDVASAFSVFLEKATSDIILQLSVRELFSSDVQYNISEDKITGGFILSEATLADLSTYAAGLADTPTRLDFWKQVAGLLHTEGYIYWGQGGMNEFGLTTTEEAKLEDAIQASDSDLVWYKEEHLVDGHFSIEEAYSGLSGVIHTGVNEGETFTGTIFDDAIGLGGSADIAYAEQGDDIIAGGAGNDTLHGGEGDDRIIGDGAYFFTGNDLLYGDEGNDHIEGTNGNDTIYGGDGDDQLWGDKEFEDSVGGDDTVDGGEGNDLLYGGKGDDILIDGYGTTGQNLMNGDEGNTIFRVVGGGAEVWIDGGHGTLEVPPAYTDETQLTFERVGAFLKITGSIPGSEINIYINYAFTGSNPVDTIHFSSGHDYDLQYQVDFMQGIATEYSDVLYSTDTTPNNTHEDTINALGGNDIVYGNGGNDRLSGGNGDDILNGEDGDDYLTGEADNDTLYGGAGNDYLGGGTGNDVLAGGANSDSLSGEVGDDTYVFHAGDGTDVLFEDASGGFDTISFIGIDPANVRLWSSGGGFQTNVSFEIIYSGTDKITIGGGGTGSELKINQQLEQITFDDGTIWSLAGGLLMTGSALSDTGFGTANDDVIYGMGGDDSISGNGGNDTIYGGDGVDSLNGGNGDDELHGGGGNDHLGGGTGNDILAGGSGSDSLSGEAGDDTYIFHVGDGTDLISESENGGFDTISFVGIDPSNVRLWLSGGGFQTNVSFEIIYSETDKITSGGGLTGTELKINQQLEQIIFDDGTIWSLAGGLLMTGSVSSDTGYGTANNDIMYGMGGADDILGNGGNDTIYGGDGADSLNGGNGDDELHGGDGNDTLFGNDGNDTLYGEAGTDSLNGGIGNDIYRFEGIWGAARINENAGEGNDKVHISGGLTAEDIRLVTDTSGYFWVYDLTNTSNSINLTSHFSISGSAIGVQAPNVELIEFDDESTIDLTGSLMLEGSGNNDTIYSTVLGDIVYGYAGADDLRGWNGNDTLYGGDGEDSLQGNNGDDELHGGEGNDTLDGGDGDDILNGEAGTDSLAGRVGNDTYIFDGKWDADRINESADEGSDKIHIGGGLTAEDVRIVTDRYGEMWIYDLTNSLNSIDLPGHFSSAGSSIGVQAPNIESIEFDDESTIDLTGSLVLEGSGNNDTIYSTALGDIVYGYGGDDDLRGWNGNDTLYGGDGEDSLHGDNGDDELHGGDGTNTLYGDAGNDILYGDTGTDYLSGGVGNDTYNFDGVWGADRITEYAGEGDDKIHIGGGLTGEDIRIVTDRDGHLWIYDLTNGSNSIDLPGYFSSAGSSIGVQAPNIEFIEFDNESTIDLTGSLVLEGGITNEIIYGTALGDIVYGYGGDDDLRGWNGNDTLYGGDGVDSLNGSNGDDELHGDAGNDTLNGGVGNDSLHGGDSTDSLYGDDGNDLLCGGSEIDYLFGGEGSDTFLFDSTSLGSVDSIRDFSIAQNDKIDLSDIIQGYDPVTDAITDFVQITTSGSDSILKVDADGNGDHFIQIATISATGLTDEQALVNSGNLIVS